MIRTAAYSMPHVCKYTVYKEKGKQTYKGTLWNITLVSDFILNIN